MPYKIIVWAQDREDGKRRKGDIADVLRPDQDPGSSITLPRFVIVNVSDGANWEQASAWKDQWRINYVFSVLQNEVDYAQYRVEVDPDVIAVSGKGNDTIKQEMRDFIEDAEPESIWYGSVIDGFTVNSMTVTIPKPHLKEQLKNDFNDKFIDVLEVKRFYFAEAGVNWAIDQGGEVTRTQAQVLNYIVDKLDE